jgi:hypothetical protein
MSKLLINHAMVKDLGLTLRRVIRAETTGENPVVADIKINTKPKYFINRIRVIGIFLWKKFK